MTSLPANLLDKPIGLQLYTVREELGKHFTGTLKRIAAIGYKEVELADTFNKTATELHAAFSDAGLACHSAHMFDFKQTPAQFCDFAKGVGANYVVTSFNPPPGAFAAMSGEKPDFDAFLKILDAMTLEDYKRSAEIANKFGEEAKKTGLQYAYHNHNLEFKKFGGTAVYDTLLNATDPELVKMELDCGWVAAAGQDPVAYLERYPERIRLLHIKAFKAGPPSISMGSPHRPEPTELGRGSLDYKPIFAAAKKAGAEQYYVEQEPPFTEMPAMEAITANYEFLHGM